MSQRQVYQARNLDNHTAQFLGWKTASFWPLSWSEPLRGSTPGSASFRWLRMSVFLPGHSWLMWGSSKAQPVWECLSDVFTDYLSIGMQDRVYQVSFRDFLKPLGCLLPVYKKLLWRRGCIIHPQNILLFHLLSSVLCLNKFPSKIDGFLWD